MFSSPRLKWLSSPLTRALYRTGEITTHSEFIFQSRQPLPLIFLRNDKQGFEEMKSSHNKRNSSEYVIDFIFFFVLSILLAIKNFNKKKGKALKDSDVIFVLG